MIPRSISRTGLHFTNGRLYVDDVTPVSLLSRSLFLEH